MTAVHDPNLNKGNHHPKANANYTPEARRLIARASSIALSTRLQYLDKSQIENIELDITFVTVQWQGIEIRSFIQMIRNTWKRIWCHLIIADHDVSKASTEMMMFTSTVLMTKIDYSSLLDESLLLNELVSKARGMTNCISQVNGRDANFKFSSGGYSPE